MELPMDTRLITIRSFYGGTSNVLFNDKILNYEVLMPSFYYR